jgi:cytoskeletal protein CcmA (bactofilin family)
MFSSKSKDTAQLIPANNSAPPPQPKRAGRPGSVPSIVSADLTVTGALNTSGDMQIDGTVEGDVRSAGLVIGEQAKIQGEVWAEDVIVRGRVVGRIQARKVLLAATCHVEGDVLAEAFAVEAGAFFEGSCKHSDNPLGEDRKDRKAPPPAASQPAASVQTGLTGLSRLQAT